MSAWPRRLWSPRQRRFVARSASESVKWRTSSRCSVGGSYSSAIWAAAQPLSLSHSCLLVRDAGRPSEPGQGVDQRVALYAEVAADHGLVRTSFKRSGDRRQFFGVSRGGTAASPPRTSATRCSAGKIAPARSNFVAYLSNRDESSVPAHLRR
jgi:hypothetical protein